MRGAERHLAFLYCRVMVSFALLAGRRRDGRRHACRLYIGGFETPRRGGGGLHLAAAMRFSVNS